MVNPISNNQPKSRPVKKTDPIPILLLVALMLIVIIIAGYRYFIPEDRANNYTNNNSPVNQNTNQNGDRKIDSPEHIWQNRESLLNQPIIVVGSVYAGMGRCTEMACSADSPCCNGCGADLGFKTGNNYPDLNFVIMGNYQGKPINCSGNNCNYFENCYPFSNEHVYYIWGILKKNDFGHFYLEFEKFDEVIMEYGT